MRRGWALLAAIGLMAGALPAAALPRAHHRHPRFIGPNPFGPQDPVPPPLPAPPNGGFGLPDYDTEPPEVVTPSPRPSLGGGGFYPQGIILDVPTATREDQDDLSGPGTNPLNRYREVGPVLAACWAPPTTFGDARWNAITIRVSFKRDGSINGIPRISYTDRGLTPAARSDLTRSLTDALHRCTPLAFSPSLGRALAGQIFAIRFLEQDHDQ